MCNSISARNSVGTHQAAQTFMHISCLHIVYRKLIYLTMKLDILHYLCSEQQQQCIEANLKNIFVSPNPTLFYRYGLVGRKIVYF